MKSIIIGVLCVVFAAVFANQIQARWDDVHQQCQRSDATHVPDEIFEQLKRGQKPTLPANFGLHANCMLVKLDLQDLHSGRVLEQGLRKAAQNQFSDVGKVNEIVRDCQVDGDSPEKIALALFKCLGDNKVNIGQL